MYTITPILRWFLDSVYLFIEKITESCQSFLIMIVSGREIFSDIYFLVFLRIFQSFLHWHLGRKCICVVMLFPFSLNLSLSLSLSLSASISVSISDYRRKEDFWISHGHFVISRKLLSFYIFCDPFISINIFLCWAKWGSKQH